MIVCPVCEHQQAQGAECEVCGKKLLHGAAAIPPVAPLEGFEPTGRPGVDAPPARMAELDPTHHAPARHVDDRVPDVDRGRADPVDPDVALLPDIDRGEVAGIPGDAPTAVPAFIVCRYCRNPAMPGERICSHCGMRLPVYEEDAAKPELAARLCSCGTPVRGAVCPNCGARR